uniref:Uncharacterized protein n=1 Tax=Pristionchus pacificus TaxID=54126 RepID=A0A2A6C610_PRIPA|eukprot:PDM73594.1 hypothetical protein PRIPAC_40950 [Pristionchus pacificus]
MCAVPLGRTETTSSSTGSGAAKIDCWKAELPHRCQHHQEHMNKEKLTTLERSSAEDLRARIAEAAAGRLKNTRGLGKGVATTSDDATAISYSESISRCP